jgi:amino acid transporter
MTVMWISFSFSGFNSAIYIAEDVEHPKLNISRALIIGTTLTTAIYLLLNYIFLFYTPASLIDNHVDIAVQSANYIGSGNLVTFIRSAILLALASSVSSLFILGPKVYQKMISEEPTLPLSHIIKNNDFIAVLAQGSLVLFLIWFSHLRELLSYLGMTLTLSSMLTVSILLRKNIRRLYKAIPIFYLLSNCIILLLASFETPKEALASVLSIIILWIVAVYKFQKSRV